MSEDTQANVAQLHEELGKIAFELSQAESVMRQAQAVHQQLQKQAGELVAQITQVKNQ